MTTDATTTITTDTTVALIKALFGGLPRTARGRIEQAEQAAEHAGLNLGTSSQAIADSKLNEVIRDSLDELGERECQRINRHISRIVQRGA